MKDKTNSMFQTGGTGIGVLNFPSLESNWLQFVSVRGASFDIRISNFASGRLGARKFIEVGLSIILSGTI